ncbi:LytR C-terminal domain-containing protein [uncultured Arthrobacter sp.]|uniref:LytR C-terminal domain-containing protein n=1 Tax=uncultured Arthrobacter sp. TaxID=114050 RepID=UPI00262472FC|nr:LytR C-terminal domain-containing protein [uncultured Arthrobacter sp.]
MTQYPRDEFDQVPESAARQGVHRERLVPPQSSGLVLKVVAGILVLAVGLAAYFLFPRLGLGQASEVTPETSSAAPMPSITADGAVAEDETAESTAAEDAADEPSTEPSASSTPAETESPSAAPTPDEEPTPGATEPSAVVDRGQPVAVLNATTVSGLASTAAGRLQVDGWNVIQIGNWSGQQLQGSVVLYNGEEQRPTAEALAAALGISAVQGDAGFGNITVVVGPGFQ